MTKQEIKDTIAEIEYYNNSAGGILCGIDIKVVNLKITKEEATADIIVNENREKIERFNDCVYPIHELEAWFK